MGKKTIALILAGGAGTRLDMLSKHRAKPAVPFAGKYRIIDFVLSNCVNSSIYTTGILTQYLPRSLSDHIGIGRPWDLDRGRGGLTMLPPYQRGESGWYKGTANAVYQNLSYVMDQDSDYVIILAGDHIYKMNYRLMIAEHEKNDADVTVAVKEVESSLAHQFGILSVDDEGQIVDFEEKPKNPKSNLASMGIYIFKTEFLKDILLANCGEHGGADFGKDIIPKLIGDAKVYSYRFEGYWRDVGTLDEYWKSNIELTLENPPADLHEEKQKIYTKSESLPPVKFRNEGSAKDSLVSNGCVIKGVVENSVISPGVIIEDGAVVKNSIIFNDTIIKKGSVIDRAIIDKKVIVGANCIIGVGGDYTPNKEEPEKLFSGLNLIAKFAHIPPSVIIERNCRIMSRVSEGDFKSRTHISSGETIHSEKEGGVFDIIH